MMLGILLAIENASADSPAVPIATAKAIARTNPSSRDDAVPAAITRLERMIASVPETPSGRSAESPGSGIISPPQPAEPGAPEPGAPGPSAPGSEGPAPGGPAPCGVANGGVASNAAVL